jgi:hypothetical protein
MFEALRGGLDPRIPFVELDSNINDPIFSNRAVQLLLELIESKRIVRPTEATGTHS